MKQRLQKPKPRETSATADSGARHLEILNTAAALFAERGYHATAVRDIGARVGLLGGSLYHYIKSKEALFVKIHNSALQSAASKIEAAIAGQSSPWERLEAACVTLAELQLDPASITMPLMNDFRLLPPELRAQLIETRDQFEAIFDRLVTTLPLAPEIDRKIYRISLLTLLNNLCNWYRPGKYAPAEIAHELMKIFHASSTPGLAANAS
ncbi:TetR/AcrR family transcriptional regulator [Acidocella sp.]|uniref:TetR/AcrR family transcriptional regulator n=1 Tax=Acidocella sp. TaxID=50710 RepID=UPI0018363A7F|nr:TetR/AcrR family transcriptional regulator [Acidocella sp.]NNM56806.1 TetR/AcrR family transcriptional regulator [Acidocella sp.]